MTDRDLYYCDVHFYKIYWDDFDDTYVGHAKDIKKRMSEHKSDSCNPNAPISKKIKERGGEFEYEVMETMWCETKLGARFREQYWINTLEPTLNVCAAFVSEEERKRKNRKWHRELRADPVYRDELNRRRRERRANDSAYRAELCRKNREYIRERCADPVYRDELNRRRRERRANDPVYRAKEQKRDNERLADSAYRAEKNRKRREKYAKKKAEQANR